MIDRPEGGERVILVHVNFPAGNMEESAEELEELALSAGADVVEVMTCARKAPESKYFVGTGKADEIRQAVLTHQAQLVIFNHVLTPAQERNLERLCSCRVLDRTGLILDIFAQRAFSFEGKLQVELAQLKHLSTRLIRGWTHLERQRGGIGLRGPGETQLEVDRRLIRQRLKFINSRLDRIKKQREQGRRARRRATVPTIALVGYTNAGKSTLFNCLTQSEVYVADQLFATLDPTLRRLDLPEVGTVILADTVGFIRHLPHDLVSAFHATLQEVSEADLLLHVVDAYDGKRNERISQVNEVLASIGAEAVPTLMVYNKVDLCPELTEGIERDVDGAIKRVQISASKALGLTDLSEAIAELLGKELVQSEVVLSLEQAKLRASLYEREAVLQETIDNEGNYHLVVRMPRVELERLFG